MLHAPRRAAVTAMIQISIFKSQPLAGMSQGTDALPRPKGTRRVSYLRLP